MLTPARQTRGHVRRVAQPALPRAAPRPAPSPPLGGRAPLLDVRQVVTECEGRLQPGATLARRKSPAPVRLCVPRGSASTQAEAASGGGQASRPSESAQRLVEPVKKGARRVLRAAGPAGGPSQHTCVQGGGVLRLRIAFDRALTSGRGGGLSRLRTRRKPRRAPLFGTTCAGLAGRIQRRGTQARSPGRQSWRAGGGGGGLARAAPGASWRCGAFGPCL
jgi:hypothetical protein